MILLLNLKVIDPGRFVPSMYACYVQLASANKHIKVFFCVTFRNYFVRILLRKL